MHSAIAVYPFGIVVVVEVAARAECGVVGVIVETGVVSSAVLFGVAARVHASCIGLGQVLTLVRRRGVLTFVRYFNFIVVTSESDAFTNCAGLVRLLEHTVLQAFD